MPTMSVVIPVHNRQHLLGRALRSVQGQTFSDFEVIVVDDGSTDDPATVVAELNDSRFRAIRQDNAGAAAARNQGARLARGSYLTFLDSDDEALPAWLESLHRAFREHSADIVCCGFEKVGVGREVEERGGVHLPQDMGPMFDHVVGRFTGGGVFAMRRQVFESVGGYTPTLQSGQHTELAMRLLPLAKARSWSIQNIMEPLVRVHVHEGPRIRGNPEWICNGTRYMLHAHRDLFLRDPRLHAAYYVIAGINAARIERYGAARQNLWSAIRIRPLAIQSWIRLGLALVPPLARRVWSRG